METVLEALKLMGKATAREISARMKIDVREILGILREHEELEQIELVNGWWQLTGTGAKTPRVKPAVPAVKVVNSKERPASPAVATPARKINEAVLAELMTQHGELTTEQMAKLAGTTVRAVASTLAMPVNKGRIVREKRGSVFHFDVAPKALTTKLPAVDDVIQQPEPAVPATRSDAEFLDAIPQMAKCQAAEMVCPTPKSIAAEIRRTKSRLNQLEELRVTVRRLARQQRALGF
ncbi:hypothetical protein M977_04119 [Buttiauxella gaviniae ATCC 51604]|uniref:DUF1627 domain-containing protein n=1 Tax=Buttiauxella gaviniae ATCC 51604 TaxID=1354253 RepID=A0A1B7HPB3_9ENTR|nr:DUF1627 domain-containing protein [Buttiauxella gaviniae]OAT17485.1 hypothetical protein M977_04119 [Buttiauxella gaviniae ATCC 51604]